MLQRTKRLETLTWAGILLFGILITGSALLYPGGNRFELGARHYSFFGNFLCDLFDRVSYNGIANPGRPFAITGTYSLAAALLLFWNLLPKLFDPGSRLARPVQMLGSLAMAASFLIATPLHDACIILAVPLGLAAFVLSIRALNRNGEAWLARLGAASVVVCIVDYLSFAFRVFPASLPGIQKAALLSFLIWVIAVMGRLSRA